MTVRWAVRFRRLELRQIARLWKVEGVEVCEKHDEIWLRGSVLNEPIDEILKGLLSGKRFRVLADGQIQSPKELVPKGYLPEREWTALRAFPVAWPASDRLCRSAAGGLPGKLE